MKEVTPHPIPEEMSSKITEDMHIQILARHGTVFATSGGNASSEYWQDVWDYLRTQHPHICQEPEQDYPGPHPDGDLGLLNTIWFWQEAKRAERRR